MSSISAGLQDRAEYQLVHIDATLPGAEQQLGILDPDAVIFDLASTEAVRVAALLLSYPRLLWIGVDLAANEALLLSGHFSCVRTGDDLVRLIERWESGSAGLSPERARAAPDDAPGTPGTGE